MHEMSEFPGTGEGGNPQPAVEERRLLDVQRKSAADW